MKHLKYEIDLSRWDIGGLIKEFAPALDHGIRQIVAAVLQDALEDDASYLYFPASWLDHDGIGGPQVQDPLTLYFMVGLDAEGGEKPAYRCNLRDIARGSMRAYIDDGVFSEGMDRVSKALRELADEIDAAQPPKGDESGG